MFVACPCQGWIQSAKGLSHQELFSPEECKSFIRLIEGLPLELTPPKKKGEADRVNRK